MKNTTTNNMELNDSKEESTSLHQMLNTSPQENVSILLPFKTIHNLRDLSGLTTANNKRIKNGKMFRSANLHHASTEELMILNRMGLKRIFDLRTEWESDAQPDRLFKSWKLFMEPVLHESILSSFYGGQISFAVHAIKDMNKAMQEASILMLSSERGKKTWKKLFEELLKDDTPILWHCTEGKDRTGMAAALIEHALSIDEDQILADYLQTNIDAAGLIKSDEQAADRIILFDRRLLEEDVDDFVTARKDYYEAANQWIKENYGSWKSYLKQEIGLSDSDFERLEKNWLIDINEIEQSED